MNRDALKQAIGPVLLIVAVFWAWRGLDLDWQNIARAPEAAARLGRDMWPADWDGQFRSRALGALVETIQISILATLIGLALSLPMALLAARNLSPAWLTAVFRFVAAAIRVPPSLLWAILMVLIFGLGPMAGVAAMGLYSAGYLAKLQYEAFEGLPRDALDAVRAMRANRFQVAWHVVLPEAQNTLRSQVMFMFEYNVRASSVIGIVGAGGIGQLLQVYLSFFQYDRVFAIMLLMLVTVVVIDAISMVVRRRFMEEEKGQRAGWKDVLAGLLGGRA